MNVFANATLACLLLGAVSASAVMDDARLEEWLSDNFTAPESMSWAEIDDFKERLGVNEDQLYRVLMKIYIEARDKWSSCEPKTLEWSRMRRTIEGVITWLPKCEDSPVKNFLLEYAGLTENDQFLRSVAVLSYLRVADADGTRNILLRLLVGDDRIDSQARSSILEHANTAYREADLGKKRAILESLYVSLANEDAKWLFRVYDRILSRLSQQYANSEQRRYNLKRLINAKPTCKADEYAMVGLENMLRELEKTYLYTTITTNLSVLKERDFSQPLSEDERIAIEVPSDAPDAVGSAHEDTPRTRRNGLYALGGVAAVLVAASALWLGFRSKRGAV